MNKRTIHFIILMKDDNKLDRDLKKIEKVVSNIKELHPEDSFKIKALWAMSPKADKNLAIFYQALERPLLRMKLEKSGHPVYFQQILQDKKVFEQEALLTEKEKKDLKKAKYEDKNTLNKLESLLISQLNILENSERQYEKSIMKVQGLLEKSEGALKNLEGTAFSEIKEKLKDLKSLLEQDINKPLKAKPLIKEALEDFEEMKPLALSKKYVQDYKEKFKSGGRELVLSDILLSNMSEELPGRYINLERYSPSETKKLLEDVEKTFFSKEQAEEGKYTQKPEGFWKRLWKIFKEIFNFNRKEANRFNILQGKDLKGTPAKKEIVHSHVMGLKESSLSSKESTVEVQNEHLTSIESDYATIEELGLSNVSASSDQASQGEVVSQKEPIYVSIEGIRAKKRLDRSKRAGSESPRVHSDNTSEAAIKQSQLPVAKSNLKPGSSLGSLLEKKDSRKERRFSV